MSEGSSGMSESRRNSDANVALQVCLGSHLRVAVPPGHDSGRPPQPVARARSDTRQAGHAPDALCRMHDAAAGQADVWL